MSDEELTVERDGVQLRGDVRGEGLPVLLLHGLTASRRYVVMGSKALERDGHRVAAFDARGHGKSSPGSDYEYPSLAADALALLDHLEIERAVLAGSSMGAHTALRLALDQPERVGALVVITPAHQPGRNEDESRLARWDELAEGLRSGGLDGFIEAYGEPDVPESYRESAFTAIRQRLEEHSDLEAVADALSAVPRSEPFESYDDLKRIQVPTIVIASRDEADGEHPFAVGERYAEELPDARLVSEEPGDSPLAWQGGRVSKLIAEVASQAARDGSLG